MTREELRKIFFDETKKELLDIVYKNANKPYYETLCMV
jgi:hypothetical protein